MLITKNCKTEKTNVTYDPNGGAAYVVERAYNTTEAPNVYSFKPDTESTPLPFSVLTVVLGVRKKKLK